MVINNNNSSIDYFLPGPNKETKKWSSNKITKQMHHEFPNFFQE